MKTAPFNSRLLVLFALGLLLTASACKKDDEPPTKTDLLASGSWVMKSFTVDPALPLSVDENGNYIYSTDLLSFYEDCELDNTWKFNADKSMILDDGKIFCSGVDEDPFTGTWSFNSGETTLTTTIDGTTQAYTISELTAELLKLKFTEKDGTTSYTFTISFSH